MPRHPLALLVGPLPPPFGGVGVLVQAILDSPLRERWRLEVFNTSKLQQEGRPSTVTIWDVAWTLWHLIALPLRILLLRPAVALVESTADTGFFRDLALALECRALGVPVVLHWHGAPDSPQFPGRSRWRRALFRFGARRAAAVIVLAETYRDGFERFVEPGRLFVVPNFTDGSAFPAERRAPDGAVTALFVGRVGPQKGTDLLFEAIARARAEVPALAAVLVGAGESADAWREASAHALVRSGVVELAGPLGPELADAYRRADLFVLPTRTDSFPLAVIEAMAAGLPVIASDVGAIRWMLDDGACGVLVPAGKVEPLVQALVRLASDPAERRALGERARRRQGERFDARSAAAAFDAVLRRASGLQRGPEAAPACPSAGPAPNSNAR